jgi:hypothetical protein
MSFKLGHYLAPDVQVKGSRDDWQALGTVSSIHLAQPAEYVRYCFLAK